MDDDRKLMRVEKFSDDHRVPTIAKHADFHSSDLAVFRQDIELLPQFGARHVVHRFHALRVLHRQRRNRRNAITSIRGESL